MALNSPLEVSVGRNTPVHIHVSRNPKSKMQALNESLQYEQSRTRGGGAGGGGMGIAGGLGYGGGSGMASGASHGRREDLSIDDLQPCCDCYAYRTRRCCECHRSGRDGVDQSIRALRSEEAVLRDYQQDIGIEIDRARRLRESLAHLGGTRADLARQLRDFDDASRTLKRMIRDLNAQTPALFAEQRELLLRQLSELEASNRNLREQLTAREAELERLSAEAAQTGRLQKSFEDMQRTMRENKTRMEEELAKRRLELARKDEEIARLQAQGGAAVSSAAEAREAAAAAEANGRAEREHLERANADMRARLQRAEEELRQVQGQLEAGTRRMQELHKQHSELESRASRMADQGRDADRLRRQRDDMSDELHDLRRRVAGAEERLAAAEAEAAQLRGGVARYEGIVNDYKEQIRRAQADGGDRDAQLADQRALNRELNARLEAQTRELRQLQNDYGGLQEQHRAGQGRLEEALARGRESANEVAALLAKITSLETALRAEKTRGDASVQETGIFVRRLEETIGQLRSELAALQSHTGTNQRAAGERIRELEQELYKATRLTDQLERLRQDHERQSEARMWSLKERLDYANTAKQSLENYVQFVRSTYSTVFDQSGTGDAAARPGHF